MPEEKSFDSTIIAKNRSSYTIPSQEPGAKINSCGSKLGCHDPVKSVGSRLNAGENPEELRLLDTWGMQFSSGLAS